MSVESVPASASIDVLGLSRRVYKGLQRAGVDTVPQLVMLSKAELRAIPSLGEVALAEIQAKLERYRDQEGLPPQAESALTLEEERAGVDERPRDDAPLSVLGLSDPVAQVLTEARISTVGELVAVPLGHFVASKRLGRKARREVEKRLRKYLRGHPAALPAPVTPTLDPELLRGATAAPLDRIPLARLGLPEEQARELYALGVESVGELVRCPRSLLDQSHAVQSGLERYLTWLVTHGKGQWEAEEHAEGISPLHRQALNSNDGNGLDGLVGAWLEPLPEREEAVIRWRFGLDEEPTTLKVAAARLGIGRQRARQIQKRALATLAEPAQWTIITPWRALLLHLLTQAGGLMGIRQLNAAVRGEVRVENLDPVGAARLVAKIDPELKWLASAQALGLTREPLSEVKEIQKRLLRILKRQERPIATKRLLALFRESGYAQKQGGALSEVFLGACLRHHPKIVIEAGRCIHIRWTGGHLELLVRVLRTLDRPTHFKMITKRANAGLAADKQLLPRQISTFLRKRPDIFVYLEGGIFGLKEWGMQDSFRLSVSA
jgi:hypothetical protein